MQFGNRNCKQIFVFCLGLNEIGGRIEYGMFRDLDIPFENK